MLKEIGIGVVFFLVSVAWLWYSHAMLNTMFPKIEDPSPETEEEEDE